MSYDEAEMLLTFVVRGDDHLVLPSSTIPARADNLWSTTCFECFVRPVESDAYQEFNFSPSSRWAAYAFDQYRVGSRDLALAAEPRVMLDRDDGSGTFTCDVDLDLTHIRDWPIQLGLSAVIEEEGGRKSYWALAHPPGLPDFHHPDCFAAELAAPKPA